jgi:hypothetical protein
MIALLPDQEQDMMPKGPPMAGLFYWVTPLKMARRSPKYRPSVEKMTVIQQPHLYRRTG